jgi:hypothetical protein
MKDNARAILGAAFTAAREVDASIGRARTDAAFAVLDGKAEAVAADANRDELGRVVRTPEAQRVLGGVSSKTLRLWAARGQLVPVYGSSRRIGYTAESVRALMQRNRPAGAV